MRGLVYSSLCVTTLFSFWESSYNTAESSILVSVGCMCKSACSKSPGSLPQSRLDQQLYASVPKDRQERFFNSVVKEGADGKLFSHPFLALSQLAHTPVRYISISAHAFLTYFFPFPLRQYLSLYLRNWNSPVVLAVHVEGMVVRGRVTCAKYREPAFIFSTLSPSHFMIQCNQVCIQQGFSISWIVRVYRLLQRMMI